VNSLFAQKFFYTLYLWGCKSSAPKSYIDSGYQKCPPHRPKRRDKQGSHKTEDAGKSAAADPQPITQRIVSLQTTTNRPPPPNLPTRKITRATKASTHTHTLSAPSLSRLEALLLDHAYRLDLVPHLHQAQVVLAADHVAKHGVAAVQEVGARGGQLALLEQEEDLVVLVLGWGVGGLGGGCVMFARWWVWIRVGDLAESDCAANPSTLPASLPPPKKLPHPPFPSAPTWLLALLLSNSDRAQASVP